MAINKLDHVIVYFKHQVPTAVVIKYFKNTL